MNKSKSELIADRNQLQALIADPNVPDIQKRTYRQTVEHINKLLTAYEPAKNAQAENATVVFPAAQPIKNQQPTTPPVKQQRDITWTKPEGLKIADTIAVQVPQGAPLIRFEWSDKPSEELREGEIRSRFTTAIRDLCNSSLVAKDRIEQITEYIVFTRAVAYYRGLTTLWNREPSMSELRITQGRVRNMIFDMIKLNAKES